MLRKFLLTGAICLPLLAGVVALAFSLAERHAAEEFYWAGLFKYWEEDHIGALADLDRALALAPGHDDALAARGEVRNAAGDYAGAVTDLDAVLAHQPDHYSARRERADALTNAGDLTGALRDFDFLLAEDAEDLGARHGRAYARRFLGDLPGALDDYTRVLAEDDELAATYSARGRLKLAQGDGAGALEDLRRGVAHGDAYGAYWAFLAAASLGRRTEAAGELDRFLAEHKADGATDWELVLGDYFLGRVAEEQLLRRAGAALTDHERRGRLCEAWFYAGALKQQAGDRAGALEYYRRTVATRRGDFLEYWEAVEQLKAAEAAPAGAAE